MRRQPVLALATKDMKRLIRDPATGFLIILFPLLLTVAFGTSFGAIGGSQSATYRLGVVNLDSGVDSPWAERLAGNLTATQILQLTPYSRNETAQSDLLQGTIHAVLLIPPDFGASCAAFWAAPSDPHRWINTTQPRSAASATASTKTARISSSNSARKARGYRRTSKL